MVLRYPRKRHFGKRYAVELHAGATQKPDGDRRGACAEFHSYQGIFRLLRIDGRLRNHHLPAYRHTYLLAQPRAQGAWLHGVASDDLQHQRVDGLRASDSFEPDNADTLPCRSARLLFGLLHSDIFGARSDDNRRRGMDYADNLRWLYHDGLGRGGAATTV